jgi:hypothetical protein
LISASKTTPCFRRCHYKTRSLGLAASSACRRAALDLVGLAMRAERKATDKIVDRLKFQS